MSSSGNEPDATAQTPEATPHTPAADVGSPGAESGAPPATHSSTGARTAPSAEEVRAWHEAYRRTGDLEMRNRIVESHLHVTEFVARRYRGRGVPEEDLRQVAALAVVRAVDRFDPEMGVTFATFAGRTVDGEVKRWFRDRSWTVRPPRRVQELHLDVRRANDEMAHALGRAPTVAELAHELGVDADAVLEALEAATAHWAASLDAPAGGTEEGATLGERVVDHAMVNTEQVDDRVTIEAMLEDLPERERQMLRLRFDEQLSQPEIAERLGVSQSYLSRLLRRTLARLRAEAEAGALAEPSSGSG